MIRSVDHIAIAVESLKDGLAFWAEALGLEAAGLETVDSEGVRVAFLPIGETRIELLEATSEDSPVGRFLQKRGAGPHHVTLRVDDIAAVLGRLAGRGIEPLGSGVRQGAGGTKVAFLHPRSTGGTLVELVESTHAPDEIDITAGQPVLLYLREPQEKLWGVLRRLDAAGVKLEGIDITSFDDWVAQLERGEESVVGPSLLFVPMIRLEKILLDRSSGHLPSLAERFFRRIGRSVQDVLADERHRGSSGD
jgi:methylmalonyl-CoA epimerase